MYSLKELNYEEQKNKSQKDQGLEKEFRTLQKEKSLYNVSEHIVYIVLRWHKLLLRTHP